MSSHTFVIEISWNILKTQIFGRPAVGRSGEISKWDPSSGRLCAQAGAQVWHLSGGEIFRHLSGGEGFWSQPHNELCSTFFAQDYGTKTCAGWDIYFFPFWINLSKLNIAIPRCPPSMLLEFNSDIDICRYPGSLNHLETDATTFANWGVFWISDWMTICDLDYACAFVFVDKRLCKRVLLLTTLH